MSRPHIGSSERRARLGLRHRLAPSAHGDSVADAASAVVALHATDAASVFLQARARMTTSSPEGIDREIHEGRTVMRVIAMRRTLFLVPVGDVAMVHAAASRAIADVERRRTTGMLAGAGIADPATLMSELEEIGLAEVRRRGEASTAELRSADPRLALKIATGVGKPYAGSLSVGSKVFFHLALDGRIARGRPRGTWVGSAYRWSPIERWLPEGVPDMDVDAARALLVRNWLRAFGPGTRDDVRWWTGWTVSATVRALETAGAMAVDLDGGATGFTLADDLEGDAPAEPWVALLPALDATTMGWADRDWYLGPHRAEIFDTNGNGGPTVWADGLIVGGWAQRPSGEVVTRLFEDVGASATREIQAEAARLEDWIGPARVSGSFPTPTEVELRA